ncbi:hypothetical protein AWV79_13055 [Cupriavidus sp. UYMMa02A]|nr:hypothetical protein AWV79_13055 [Cupriavidus sp. UYMMa02A]
MQRQRGRRDCGGAQAAALRDRRGGVCLTHAQEGSRRDNCGQQAGGCDHHAAELSLHHVFLLPVGCWNAVAPASAIRLKVRKGLIAQRVRTSVLTNAYQPYRHVAGPVHLIHAGMKHGHKPLRHYAASGGSAPRDSRR